MKPFRNIFFIIICTVFAISVSQAQDNVEADYNAAVNRLKSLRIRQDSTQTQINKNRQLLENRPDNKEAYSKQIIALEDMLYEINSQISKASARVISLEALLPKTTPKQSTTTSGNQAAAGKESRNLFDNYFFVTNIASKDRAKIKQVAQAEARATELIKSVETTYDELKELKQIYDNANSQKWIDELRPQSFELKEKIQATDAEIEKWWTELYNFKIDTYQVLVDKLSGIDRLQLEQIDNDHRAVRRAESLAESQIAPNAVIFPLQKELALHYELLLASNLELKLAQDSLTKQLSTLNKSRLDLPKIEFEPRSLVVYSDVTLNTKYDYTSVDSIPEVVVPTKGIYYSVQVAAMSSKPTSLNFFKGGKPLQMAKLANGMNQYMLGGFKTYAKAQACVNQLYRAGYKGPSIIAWVDGVYTTAAKAKVAEETLAKQNDGEFKIEIRTRNSALSSSLREIVDMHAKGKQISRIQDGQELLFTILQFNNKAEAEVLAEIIRTKENTKAEVISIEKQ